VAVPIDIFGALIVMVCVALDVWTSPGIVAETVVEPPPRGSSAPPPLATLVGLFD
jgi:hypothetical protein